MRDLKFAMIGGWHIHTDRFCGKVNEYPGCSVAAIWDADVRRGRERAERFQCRFEEKYENILCDPTIDGVLITSAVKLHYGQIKQALEAGKHVFVEKPAFFSKEEGEEIRAILHRTGLKFLVSDPIRTSMRQLKCAKEIMDSGRLGQITTVRTRCAMSEAVEREQVEAFRADITGGGVMFDIGCHAVHMLAVLMGKPKKVHAAFSGTSVAAGKYGVEDNAVAVYEYENGVLGIAETSFLAERREDFFLVSGTMGSILCLDRELFFRVAGGDWVRIPPEEWPSEETYPLYRWIDRIWDGKEVGDCGIEDALLLTGMIVGAYRASGQSVEL